MNARVVKFHPTHSLGELYLSELNRLADWVEYLDAQGEVLARLYPFARLSPPHRGALNLAVGFNPRWA